MAQGSLGGYRFEFCPSLHGTGAARLLVELQVPGEHNVRNALAALAVADQMRLPLPKAVEALSEFKGAERRFEVRGEAGGVTIIDDYAHHPTEIRATLAAARMRYPGREIWAVWQPHTYSRTIALMDDFASALKQADHIIVTEVFASREAPRTDFSSTQVVRKIDHPDAHYSPDLAHAAVSLLARLHSGDVLVVLSAGDADQISTNVLAALQERSHPNVHLES
jgi:UDP-N-acetylmuramate--alanine ligase